VDFCADHKNITQKRGVSAPRYLIPATTMGAMAQPHKGPRRLVQTRIPEEVYAELVRRAREAGTSTSQYIADSMALSVGRDDLVWELGREREALPLAM
jgi:predicted HicB family RNase H-like nuclease